MPEAELYEIAREYRGEFPIFRSAVYLNSCSLGALSVRSRGALEEFAALWDRWGASAWYEHWLAAAQDVRDGFAALIGAGPEETALAPSVSAALASLTSGLDFGSRPKVITSELDFPTLVYHFQAQAPRGVETVILRSPDGVTVPVEAFREVIDERTALIATSHVYFATGAIQDVPTLARMAHESGALCLIDAYQSIGQVPVDARELGVDILIGGALKWLLGGAGLAYVYVRRAALERLMPTVVSWFGVEDQFAFDVRGPRLRRDARRFELGTHAVPTLYTARAGLDLVSEVGADRIRRRVSALAEDLIERARAKGLRVRCAPGQEQRSGIVMIPHPDPAAAVSGLMGENIIADHRPGAVRLSPHFYNTTEDADRAIQVLARAGAW